MTRDEEAEFTALLERQSRFVFRVAYAVLLNTHDAEDAVQETFLKLYRNGGWRDMREERAFLARVAWRVAVDRRPRTPNAISLDVDPGSEARHGNEPVSALPCPEQAVVAANQRALVHAMIDALPEELRVPLALSAFQELNSRAIAGILDIPEGTVRTRLQRARLVLRDKLAHLKARSQSEIPNRTPNQETHYA